jgi:hypothetical protein
MKTSALSLRENATSLRPSPPLCGGEGEELARGRFTGPVRCKFSARKLRHAEEGMMLIDCLVSIALFFVVTGAAFSFFYTCWEGSSALRRNTDDITGALRAGEMWRADVRSATGALRVEDAVGGEVLRIPEKSGEVVYKFADGALSRNSGGGWTELLAKVKTSRMESERRQQVTAWRWEVELMTKKRTLQVKPLFTFEAVPSAATNP